MEFLQLFDKFLWWAFKQSNTKLMEAQSKIGTLDAKIVKLMYVLRREVGDHIPIDKVSVPYQAPIVFLIHEHVYQLV
jgi:hypothetical protein